MLALFPDKTWKNAVADEGGTTAFDLHSALPPMIAYTGILEMTLTVNFAGDPMAIAGSLPASGGDAPDFSARQATT